MILIHNLSCLGQSEHAQKQAKAANLDQINGATVTFPDGVIVSIRQTSARALTRFLESYNKLSGRHDVQPK